MQKTKDEEALFSLEMPGSKTLSRRPLAEHMRPQSLNQVLGQQHLLGDACLLPKLIRENRVGNIILAGPPGTGKTTLATVIAEEGKCKLLKVNAVTSNVAELRETLKLARYHGADNCYLFVDEIHRSIRLSRIFSCPTSNREMSVSSGQPRIIQGTILLIRSSAVLISSLSSPSVRK